MPSAILVEQGGFLLFNNVRVADLASTTDYTYSASQPYVNQGVGYGLFPTITLAPRGTVSAKRRTGAQLLLFAASQAGQTTSC
jgi:hypothetical protein